MTIARSQTVFPKEIQVLHIWCRVVRRSFLSGYDNLLKQDYEHRREWLRERFKFVAKIYAIDIVTFSIMDNHYHLLVRTRPDVVAAMTDEEVVRNILRLGGEYWYQPDGSDRKKIRREINRRLADKKWLKRARLRLSNVSKMMQTINQSIARRANMEDGVKGRFFEARFGHEVLVDVPDVLACAMYIDLNPVRAKKASSPEESEYTGAYERVNDLRMHVAENDDGTFRIGLNQSGDDVHRWERLGEGNSGWLSPLSIDERKDPVGADRPEPVNIETMLRRRASNKGVFSMSLLEYLELLDFTGRRQRPDKRGAIDESMPPVLERLGFDFEQLENRVEYLAATHSLYFEATERQGRPDGEVVRDVKSGPRPKQE